MRLPPAQVIPAADKDHLDEAIREAPSGAAVFLLWPREGDPYLGRTAAFRRRLNRLLRRREGPSRLLNLRDVAARVEYWPSGSRLESSLLAWRLGRQHLPDTYRKLLKLRMPPYVKLIRSNVFPRTQVTTKLSGSGALFFGPFGSRPAAERFEGEFLDLFQIRRCPENLAPSPSHPGCIYGEMNRCLRPCQSVVSVEEYASEVERVSEFLSSGGESLLRSVVAARDRFSAETNFEEAARQHKRHERIQQVLKLRDDLAQDIDGLHGVAVTPSPEPETVTLWFLVSGVWLDPAPFPLGVVEGKPVSLDKRLRERATGLRKPKAPTQERQEHLAILARWFYSSWRDGEFLRFDNLEALPYRKLVNAIHRVATGRPR